jgi:hypothetical protein
MMWSGGINDGASFTFEPPSSVESIERDEPQDILCTLGLLGESICAESLGDFFVAAILDTFVVGMPTGK